MAVMDCKSFLDHSFQQGSSPPHDEMLAFDMQSLRDLPNDSVKSKWVVTRRLNAEDLTKQSTFAYLLHVPDIEWMCEGSEQGVALVLRG